LTCKYTIYFDLIEIALNEYSCVFNRLAVSSEKFYIAKLDRPIIITGLYVPILWIQEK